MVRTDEPSVRSGRYRDWFTVAGRIRRETEPLIGMFVNTQALRVDLSADPSTEAPLAQVKATAVAAQAHQDIPFEQVVEAVSPSRNLSYSPLFQVMLALQNTPEESIRLEGLTLLPITRKAVKAQFDLSLDIQEHNGQLDRCCQLCNGTLQRRHRQTVSQLLGTIAYRNDGRQSPACHDLTDDANNRTHPDYS
ncbi:condensation domain-containing protein [Vibrio sp. PP-XX7]